MSYLRHRVNSQMNRARSKTKLIPFGGVNSPDLRILICCFHFQMYFMKSQWKIYSHTLIGDQRLGTAKTRVAIFSAFWHANVSYYIPCMIITTIMRVYDRTVDFYQCNGSSNSSSSINRSGRKSWHPLLYFSLYTRILGIFHSWHSSWLSVYSFVGIRGNFPVPYFFNHCINRVQCENWYRILVSESSSSPYIYILVSVNLMIEIKELQEKHTKKEKRVLVVGIKILSHRVMMIWFNRWIKY